MPEETVPLTFGIDGQFSVRAEGARRIECFAAPQPLADVETATRTAVGAPREFPPLHQCLVPGDRIALVLDRRTPEAPAVVAGLWSEMANRDVSPPDVTIIQPADFSGAAPTDPRTRLPESIRTEVQWRIHDPTVANVCGYLGTNAAGDRIYIARDVVDADVVVPVGCVEFDRLWGYRGLQSAIFPGLSTIEAIRKSHGQPHEELGIDDARPLRQKAEEIAWMLGVQFGVAVVPAGGAAAHAVLGGQVDAVMRDAVRELNQSWRFRPPKSPELVVTAVDADAGGHGWEQVAAALHAAKGLVARDGRIVVLSQLDAPLTDGLQLIRESRKPRDAMRPLREQSPPDLLTATALAQSVEWANVYLLSRLEPDLVEELFMIPLGGLDEVERLISGEDSVAVIASGQHVCTERTAAASKSQAKK
jgi:nickel-dependent lactate racemase